MGRVFLANCLLVYMSLQGSSIHRKFLLFKTLSSGSLSGLEKCWALKMSFVDLIVFQLTGKKGSHAGGWGLGIREISSGFWEAWRARGGMTTSAEQATTERLCLELCCTSEAAQWKLEVGSSSLQDQELMLHICMSTAPYGSSLSSTIKRSFWFLFFFFGGGVVVFFIFVFGFVCCLFVFFKNIANCWGQKN